LSVIQSQQKDLSELSQRVAKSNDYFISQLENDRSEKSSSSSTMSNNSLIEKENELRRQIERFEDEKQLFRLQQLQQQQHLLSLSAVKKMDNEPSSSSSSSVSITPTNNGSTSSSSSSTTVMNENHEVFHSRQGDSVKKSASRFKIADKLNISKERLEGIVFQQLYLEEKEKNSFFQNNFIRSENGKIHILNDGYYSLIEIIEHLTSQKISDNKAFVSLYDFTILLRKTSRIEIMQNQFQPPMEGTYTFALIEYIPEYERNIEINMKIIRLNILTQRILFQFSVLFNFDLETYMNRYIDTKAEITANFSKESPVVDVFPYPAEAFTFFGELKRVKRVKGTKIGSKKSCAYCASLGIFFLEKITDSDKSSASSSSAENDKKKTSTIKYKYSEKVHFDKTCVYDSSLDFNKFMNFITTFDTRIRTINEFVQDYKILDNLKSLFPAFGFQDSYMDHLFYFDGTSYNNGYTNKNLTVTKTRYAQIANHLSDFKKQVNEAKNKEREKLSKDISDSKEKFLQITPHFMTIFNNMTPSEKVLYEKEMGNRYQFGPPPQFTDPNQMMIIQPQLQPSNIGYNNNNNNNNNIEEQQEVHLQDDNIEEEIPVADEEEEKMEDSEKERLLNDDIENAKATMLSYLDNTEFGSQQEESYSRFSNDWS
jgi:hypothetical protein